MKDDGKCIDEGPSNDSCEKWEGWMERGGEFGVVLRSTCWDSAAEEKMPASKSEPTE
jgi:hypothetical protein